VTICHRFKTMKHSSSLPYVFTEHDDARINLAGFSIIKLVLLRGASETSDEAILKIASPSLTLGFAMTQKLAELIIMSTWCRA